MREPGLYGAAPGADFPAALVNGLRAWAIGRAPDALARVTVLVNTRRMQRRLKALFDAGPPCLLPRILLVTDVEDLVALPDLPPAVPPLRRRLELAQLVRRLIVADPELAPAAASFDLAESLARLLDEMQGEGVGVDALSGLDVSDQSGHWERCRRFLELVGEYLSGDASLAADPEARLRLATQALIETWQSSPPDHPVVVAGSTGSRGTTAMLMMAVARLPEGRVILPGFDFDMPAEIWDRLMARADEPSAPGAEDHPQFRFARLLARMDRAPGGVRPLEAAEAPDPARNRLVSMSLRPAPVTDQWLRQGPALGDLRLATRGLSLLEAPDARGEADAIALILRHALETGRTAALVSPDRMLTRRVAARLDRWGLEPDDSAGEPLALSAPGRLLRQVSALAVRGADAGSLLALLKHPLTHSAADRGPHLRRTRELELWIRRQGLAFPDAAGLARWAEQSGEDAHAWASWLAGLLPDAGDGARPLAAWVSDLLDRAGRLAAGPGADPPGPLWDRAAGRKAWEVGASLSAHAAAGGEMTAAEFDRLLHSILAGEEARDPERPRTDLMIWGTMEARVQGADLVVLGGLNEGVWPESPVADPWLNRRMRAEAGLLLPERRIGLAAHDYQQAAGAPEVVLSRSRKAADAEPVPARWLNRLVTLLRGLPSCQGPEALADMRARGDVWLARARTIDAPRPEDDRAPARRPAPRPPLDARPRELPVTSIQTLIRDPFAVYARRVLGLRRLNPLTPVADAPLRGQMLHRIFDTYMRDRQGHPSADPVAQLLEVAHRVLRRDVPWPMARRLFFARVVRVADWFVADEARRSDHEFLASERSGQIHLSDQDFTLTATADRIDRLPDGSIAIIDYKTGKPPSAKVMTHFDMQLPLEALIAANGGFGGIDPVRVDHIAHIGLGSSPVYSAHSLADESEPDFALPAVREGLERLIAAYGDPDKGYMSRRATDREGYEGDYDHLARFGEWSGTDPAHSVPVGGRS